MDLAIDQTSARDRLSLAERLFALGLPPVTNIATQEQRLVQRRAGRIVAERGRLQAVHGRWVPYYGNLLQVYWDTAVRQFGRDRCEIYFHQPRTASSFLTLSYVRSGPETSPSTIYAATLVLDEIARLKSSNAIVTQVTNSRITDRLLARLGWQAHCEQWRGRHFIKRFYGHYPVIPAFWRSRLSLRCCESLA